jgi:hypothetical protein
MAKKSRMDHGINLTQPKGVRFGNRPGDFPFTLGTPYLFLTGPTGCHVHDKLSPQYRYLLRLCE